MRHTAQPAEGGRPRSRFTPLLALVLLLPACAGDASGLNPFSGTDVLPLSKADGWRDGLADSFRDQPFALVEIAPDRETAERAWQENVPDGQPERSGRPDRDGRYGDLADVDFETEVVVVYSSGQSGSCPGWLDGINTTADGTVEIERGVSGSNCTDDYNQYRMVAAVDRDLLPAMAELPTEQVEIDGRALGPGSLVRSYPS